MKSKAILFLLLGTVVIGGGGYTYIAKKHEDDARRDIDIALAKSGLTPYVTYKDVSVSLLSQSADVSDVRISHPRVAPHDIAISNLTIDNLEYDDRDKLIGFSATMDEVKIPLLKLLQTSTREKSERDRARFFQNFKTIIGLGYTDLDGTIEISARMDDALQDGKIDISFDVADAGSVGLGMSLTQLRSHFLLRLSELGTSLATQDFTFDRLGEYLQAAAALMDDAKRLQLERIEATVRDAGLLQRLDHYESETVIGGLAQTEARERIASDAHLATSQKLQDLGASRINAGKISDAVEAFVLSGNALTMKTDIRTPIPLFRSGGFIGILPSREIENMDVFIATTAFVVEGN